ncbi:MAG: dUTP diphosphatase [Candidatus Kapabacteria bacterium]|nr:dUTP diphosphatase [Candidatus Kapabacteria bacterium]
MTIPISVLPHAADLPLPFYATEGSAGMDIHAAVDEPLTLAAGKVILVPTGLSVAIPVGFEIQVRSRSGLAAKNGVFALNSPGTIDSDYRGEIKVILANFSDADFHIERGMRIAQLVVARHEHIHWELVESLDSTSRSAGGFGSTGERS